MAAPQTYTVTNVRRDEKGRQLVALSGLNEELGVWVPKDEQLPTIEDQQEIKGWVNQGKDGGRYFRPATGNAPQRSSNGSSQAPRDDATGRSIERQVAAKIAGALIGHEGYASMGQNFAGEFRRVTDAVYAAISNDDSDIPFS